MPCYNNQRRMPEMPVTPEPLAMARVVNQKPNSPTYDIETAFVKGTVFKQLDKPFLGRGACR